MRISGRLRAAPAALVWATRAGATVLHARRALRGGATTDDLLRRVSARPPRTCPPPASAAAAVRRAGRLLPGTTCVPKAIAMAGLLGSAGRDVVVVLGTRREASGSWAAHAWVEVDGEPWLAGAVPYQRLAAYEAHGDWALVPDRGPA